MSEGLTNGLDVSNEWGLRDTMEETRIRIASMIKALGKAQGKNRVFIQKKLDDLNRKHKELYNTITARIQINVYENRLKCAKWSKHWPQYKKACEDLKKIAKL